MSIEFQPLVIELKKDTSCKMIDYRSHKPVKNKKSRTSAKKHKELRRERTARFVYREPQKKSDVAVVAI